LDEFCFQCKRIERRCIEYARNSYRDDFIVFLPRSYSHVLFRFYSRALSRTSSRVFLSSLMDLSIAHMVLVHERTALSLDALVSSGRMIKCWIPKIYLTNPNTKQSTFSRPV
jgi:hypothetical protein